MLSDTELENIDVYELDDGALEAENRMKNLMWTVSGDYHLDTKLDLSAFSASKYVAMYDAVKQGGFSRYYDKDAFALYLAKKLYLGAQSGPLTNLAQLCVDAAVYPFVVRERPGVKEIRSEAFSYLLDRRFAQMNETLIGKVKLAMMRGVLSGSWDCEGRVRRPLEQVRALAELKTPDTRILLETVDALYNSIADPEFEKKHGALERVLEVTLEEMREASWQEFADEEAWEELLEQFKEDAAAQIAAFDAEPSKEELEEAQKKKARVIQVDTAALEKMAQYMELNFGRSYLSEAEQKRKNYQLCTGAHADCALYYTEGIIEAPVKTNAQYVNSVRHAKNNQRLFLNMQNLVRRNVEMLTAYLKRSLYLRTVTEQVPSTMGTVIPRRLWKVGRTEDPGKLFYRTTRQGSNEFAVEILMDASGSQRERQGQVALQGYIISAALSGAGLAHRIESFCAFWDYTVMQRFRDFDDPPAKDKKVLQFTTSSNNRDGLAIRAAGEALLARPEENRILIVLSDGKPNDVIVNRPGSRNPLPYCGDYAVKDTASEVRALRSQGLYVLGVFTGKERELQAEKRIFGKDFAYVRDIRNFSKVVSVYLHRLLEQDVGEV